MHVTLGLLLTAVLLAKVSVAVPSGRYSNRHRKSMFSEQSDGKTSSVEQPASVESQPEPVPLLKQVFTTVTRKHDNLNDASINSQGNSDLKYQSGPSFEVEGSGVNSDQGEVVDSGAYDDSNITPGVYEMPQDTEGGMEIAPTPPADDFSSEEGLPPQAPDSRFNNKSSDAQGTTDTGSVDALPFDLPSQLVNTLGQSLPQQALLDQVQGNSAQAGHALSDSNQFDQAQTIEQTLYQPSQPTEEEQPPSPEEPEEPKSSGSRCLRCN